MAWLEEIRDKDTEELSIFV